MTRRSADGAAILRAFTAAVAHFEGHVDAINALNVFPVPDGDTGTNMMATLRSALEEAEGVPEAERDAGRVAAAISFGALMGARGNSGVILSQVFRGMSEAVKGRKRINGLDLAHALAAGRVAAYAAVAKPVEGTILTVIREASAAAVTSAERDPDIEGVLTATVEQAERAVAKTPSLLPILREAGVVDSGGEGLYRLFQGALLHLVAGQGPVASPVASGASPRRAALVAHADEGFGYETMFLLTAGEGRLDLDAIRKALEAMGESVLVAGDAHAVKVHVHNEHPDAVIGYGLSLGNLSRISVENLDNQARDLREARADAFTSAPSSPVVPVKPLGEARASADGVQAGAPTSAGAATTDGDGVSVVAVAAGDGIERLLASVLSVSVRAGSRGTVAIVRGGQSANPSTGELLRAIRETRTRHVIVLPNNPNVKLAAQQAAALAPDKRVVVVPTRNAAEGIAALLGMDPGRGSDENASLMLAAARGIQSLQVTDAVRDARIGRRKVKKGQTIVLDPDDGLVAVGGNRRETVLKGLAALEAGFELVSIYYGSDISLDEAEAMSGAVTRAFDGVDVELINGGQPHYHYLIATE
ncbi:MAG: DAK2 domain-containing protein [Candidatus Limnocylindrales bacterium]